MLILYAGGGAGSNQHSATCARARRRGFFLAVSFVMFALLTGFGPPKMVDREIAPHYRVSVGELRQWAEHTSPQALSAEAVLLYDAAAGQVVFERGARAPLSPASLTKLMTALLVLERGDLDAVATIEAADMVEGAAMGLSVGESLRVEELLWGLLVPSGNDAAMALARTLAGSADAFVAQMNRRAAQLGLTETHFVNPHGLDVEGHVSSAHDVLALTLALWQYDLFREIVQTRLTTVAGHGMLNTNELLGVMPGVNGVKTGTTDEAGECLVAGFVVNGRQMFAVILGSRARYQDATRLHALSEMALRPANGEARELSVLNRAYDESGAMRFLDVRGDPPQRVVSWLGPELKLFRRIELSGLSRSMAGEPVGLLEWRVDGSVVHTQTLVAR